MFPMFPTPKQLGLKGKFQSWRPDQPKVIQDGLDAVLRWTVQKQQQGKGKTLSYIAQGLIDSNKRYVFLTATKGLQDQLLDDFDNVGLVDLRGKASYQCDGYPGQTCAEGSVARCIYKGSSMCSHHHAKQDAGQSRLVSTNYSCWIATNKYSGGLGKVDVLVCDEAHNIPTEIEKAMSVLLGENEICHDMNRDWPDYKLRNDMAVWKKWALTTRVIADRELQRLKIELDRAGKSASTKLAKQYNHSLNLVRRLADIATCRPADWIADEWNHGFKFDPITPADSAERILWRGVPKIMLTSGTITHKTCEQSGVDMSDCKFYDYWSDIDPARTPVIYIPTTSVNHYSQPWQLRKMVARIDEVIDGRLDRKGIVHTSNNKLRDFILANSRYGDTGKRLMVSNYSNSGELTSQAIERFKAKPAPALMVSASLTTGYDFPYDDCRYQIIAKLNYPYAGSKVEKERMRLDPDRGSHHAAVTLQQSAMRGYRADDDFQEVFILDDAFPTLKWRHESSFNPTFLACVRKLDAVPSAPSLEVVAC